MARCSKSRPHLNTDPNGLEVGSMTYSINDKALGSGEPIRVRKASGC